MLVRKAKRKDIYKNKAKVSQVFPLMYFAGSIIF